MRIFGKTITSMGIGTRFEAFDEDLITLWPWKRWYNGRKYFSKWLNRYFSSELAYVQYAQLYLQLMWERANFIKR